MSTTDREHQAIPHAGSATGDTATSPFGEITPLYGGGTPAELDDQQSLYGDGDDHPLPTDRLRALLAPDRGDIAALTVYTAITGLLALAVPLGVQALVNTVAQGIFLQPLVVLALVTFGALLFLGALRLAQLALVERLQQRVFARIALRMALTLPRVRHAVMGESYIPETVNRFFDISTIQKALSKLLLDGLTMTLTAIGGLTLMAFYSGWLLAFALAVVLSTLFILLGLGRGGLRTSIAESVMKYKVADWLEELARCHTGFKIDGDPAFLARRADDLVVGWVDARRRHFRVLFRQAFANHLFQAAAVAGLLAIGGWLVINRQLTLGQLVASQLVIVSVLSSIDYLVKQCEHVYDLLTGLDKIGHVTDLPVERTGGLPLPAGVAGAYVRCRGVHHRYGHGLETLRGIDLELTPGARVGLVGASGAGKSTFASLLSGLEEPTQGSVEIDGLDVRQADLASLRRAVAVVADHDDLFSGTLDENIVVGRPDVTPENVRRGLEVACLDDDVARLPDGLATRLVSGGRNLSRGQRQRLLIARAVAGSPRLLILDEAFTGIEERTRQTILARIFDPANPWTVLAITHLDEVVVRCGSIRVIADGRLVESGTVSELADDGDSELAGLFPFLCGDPAARRRAADFIGKGARP